MLLSNSKESPAFRRGESQELQLEYSNQLPRVCRRTVES